MGDDGYIKAEIVVDASPLIYLAKLDALEAFRIGGYEPLVPEALIEETTRPALVYRHPDAGLIETAVGRGLLRVTALLPPEITFADWLSERVPGLHPGECQVLAVAKERALPAMVFERRGRAIARAHGIGLTDVMEVLFEGTGDNDLLESRVRRFAEMVDMRLADFEALRGRIAERKVR